MIRAISSAILGYVTMVIVILGGIAATWFGLGNRFAFVDNTNQASLGWSLLQLVSGLVASCLGGWVAARVAASRANLAIKIFTGLILVLGLLSLAMHLAVTPPPLPEGKTIDSLTFTEAAEFARSPVWYDAVIILVGILGIRVGAAIALPARDPSRADTLTA
jgi:hypothetical protein